MLKRKNKYFVNLQVPFLLTLFSFAIQDHSTEFLCNHRMLSNLRGRESRPGPRELSSPERETSPYIIRRFFIPWQCIFKGFLCHKLQILRYTRVEMWIKKTMWRLLYVCSLKFAPVFTWQNLIHLAAYMPQAFTPWLSSYECPSLFLSPAFCRALDEVFRSEYPFYSCICNSWGLTPEISLLHNWRWPARSPPS